MEEKTCLFCRISNKSLPADIVWENDTAVAFRDIHPKAPVHILVVPKKHISSLAEVGPDDESLLGSLLLNVRTVAEQLGVAEHGFRTIINTRSHGGQEVDHLHIHILGGKPIGPMVSRASSVT